MKRWLIIIYTLMPLESINAQSLEPKLYANVPIGLNLTLLGYSHTQGAIPENQSLGLEDPNLKINSAVFVYGRSFDLWGNHTKFDFILPYSSLSGTAKVNGLDASRDVIGLGDAKARFTFNIFGAPSLTLDEFATYEQDLIIGMSIQTTIPTGQYDSSKLVNIGTNRWAVKPAIGISKRVFDFTFEFDADVEFYTTNDSFYGGVKREQEPVYSIQAHLLYTFRKGMWLAVGSTYYWGGEYSNDNIPTDSKLSNSRLGMTFTLPIDKQNSIKIYGSKGINVRYGTDFDGVTIVWQYGWAD